MYLYNNNSDDVVSFNLVRKSARKLLQIIITLT